MHKITLGFQEGENTENLGTWAFRGDVLCNPQTVLCITKVAINGINRKELAEAPDCLGGGQIPKTSGCVKNGD